MNSDILMNSDVCENNNEYISNGQRIYDTLIKKINMECPLCNKVHEMEERKRMATTKIKGEYVEYEERYYFCPYSDEEENEFAPAKMENDNLLNARNAYRVKHNLLTSHDIVEIRERYGLSQTDLAKLLGWGEATISRYESKAIQDEAYDNMLRIIKDNPLRAYKFLQRNRDKFTSSKNLEIRNKITFNLDLYGREYLKRQALESEYVNFLEPSDENGNQLLNIDKIESMVSYFAAEVMNLYKVKLMKMLWYADSLCFKYTGRALTGLVYRHQEMGPLPVGHYRIVDLENINMQEEEGFEYTKYHFLPNSNLDLDAFSEKEKEILHMVVMKFKEFSAADIVKYMHEERAYTDTRDGEIIPFSLAKEIRDF